MVGLDEETPALESLPNSKMVNALDVFFRAVLGQTSFIITFNQNRMRRQKETFDFIARELPAGGTPIIIGFLTGLKDQSDFLDRDLVIKGRVVITSLSPISVSEPVNMDDVIDDKVTIRQETVVL